MFRIMTSNIWGDYFGNEVQRREDQLFEVYMNYLPDVLGIQEVTPNWHASTLIKNMQERGYTILDDAPSGVNNYNVMFVRADRFTVLESGFEQLAHTDDRSKNIQWAAVRDAKTGKNFAFCNTHFEYRVGPQYDEAREFNAEQLAWRMNWLRNKYECAAAFGFGDMNTTSDSGVFAAYERRGLRPLADLVPSKPAVGSIHGYPVRKEDGFFHGAAPVDPFSCSIDHIVGTAGGYAVADYRIVIDQAALDATDHSPVYADLNV